MDLDPTLFRLIGVSLFLIFLMVVAYHFLKKSMVASKKGVNKRIEIVETKPLDQKRQMMLLSIDDSEYVVLLSPTGETLLPHIKPEKTQNFGQTLRVVPERIKS